MTKTQTLFYYLLHPLNPMSVAATFYAISLYTPLDVDILIGEGIHYQKFLIGGWWMLYSAAFYRITRHRAILLQRHKKDLRKRRKKGVQKGSNITRKGNYDEKDSSNRVQKD